MTMPKPKITIFGIFGSTSLKFPFWVVSSQEHLENGKAPYYILERFFHISLKIKLLS